MKKMRMSFLMLIAVAGFGFLSLNCGDSSSDPAAAASQSAVATATATASSGGATATPTSGGSSTVINAANWTFTRQDPATAVTPTFGTGTVTFVSDTNNDQVMTWNTVPTSADVTVTVVFTADNFVSKGMRVFVRGVSSPEMTSGTYMASITASALKIYKRLVGGSSVQLTGSASGTDQGKSTVASADGLDHTLVFKVAGSTISASIDGGTVLEETNTEIAAAGKIGIVCEKTSVVTIKSVTVQ
jgi:hypothetical protein